jgi:nicotinamidase-related amidase
MVWRASRVPSLPKDAVLMIIDVQKGFDSPSWGRRNNPMAEENISRLLAAWRSTGRPVFHVKHMSKLVYSPLRGGQPGNEIKEVVKPEAKEPIIEKSVNSAFIGTNLENLLRARGLETLIITGLTTDHCVSTTTRMAGNMGFNCYVVADATATFERTGHDGTKYSAGQMHDIALASLNEEFASVVETDRVLRMIS